MSTCVCLQTKPWAASPPAQTGRSVTVWHTGTLPFVAATPNCARAAGAASGRKTLQNIRIWGFFLACISRCWLCLWDLIWAFFWSSGKFLLALPTRSPLGTVPYCGATTGCISMPEAPPLMVGSSAKPDSSCLPWHVGLWNPADEDASERCCSPTWRVFLSWVL